MKFILMRHAKSSWKYSDLDDFSRPLNGRGRRSADAIGRWLAQKDHVPEALFCSPSARTMETWSLVRQHFPPGCNEVFDRLLYHGGEAEIRRALRGAGDAECVMVIGHNPSVQLFAESIMEHAPVHPDFWRFPTAATLVVECRVDAPSEIEMSKGEFIDFIAPRDLI